MSTDTVASPGALHLGRPNRPKKLKEKKGPKGLPGTNRRHAPKRTLENALARLALASSDCVYEATIISSLDRRIVPGLGTMGVEFVGARPTLYYDPDFVSEISDHELKVTLKHEVMHLTLHHQVRGAMIRRRFNFEGSDLREKILQQRAHWLASDWAVNELLLREEPAMGYENKIIGYWALPAEHDLPLLRSYEEYYPMALDLLRKRRERREKEQAEAAKSALVIIVAPAPEDGAGEPQPGGEALGEALGEGAPVLIAKGPAEGGGKPSPGSENPDSPTPEEPGAAPKAGEKPSPEPAEGKDEAKDGAKPDAAGDAERPAEEKPKPRARPANLDELLEAAQTIAELVAADEKKAAEVRELFGEDDDMLSERSLHGVLDHMPSRDELASVADAIIEAAQQTVRGHGKSVPNVFKKTKVTPRPEPLRGIAGLLAALGDIEPTNPTSGYLGSMRHVSRPAAARSLYYRNLGGRFAALARRMPLFPGVENTAPTLTLAIVLDTSGSMTQRMLSYGIAVVRDVMEELGIEEGVLLECDDRTVRAIRLERGVDLPEELVGRGGTNFDPGLAGAMQWARENDVTLDGIVYITDGEASRPQVKVDVPTVWALVGSHPRKVLDGVPGNTNVILEESA